MSEQLSIETLDAMLQQAFRPRERTPDGEIIITDEEAVALHERGVLIIQDGTDHSILMTHDMREKVRRVIAGEQEDDPRAHGIVRLLDHAEEAYRP